MSIFRKREENGDIYIDVYDPDEEYDLMLESALYVEAQPLKDTSFTFYPRDIYRLDTNALLESIEELPYEFRCYYDTRRAFAKSLEKCREEVVGFVSYKGGRSASDSHTFEYDGRRVTIDITVGKESDTSPYSFTAEIHVS